MKGRGASCASLMRRRIMPREELSAVGVPNGWLQVMSSATCSSAMAACEACSEAVSEIWTATRSNSANGVARGSEGNGHHENWLHPSRNCLFGTGRHQAAQCRQHGRGTPTWCQGRAAPPPKEEEGRLPQPRVFDRPVLVVGHQGPSHGPRRWPCTWLPNTPWLRPSPPRSHVSQANPPVDTLQRSPHGGHNDRREHDNDHFWPVDFWPSRLLAQTTCGPCHFWPTPLLARTRSYHFWPRPP